MELNTSNVYSIANKKYTLQLGAYNGKIQMTLWDKENKGRKPESVDIMPDHSVILRMKLEGLLKGDAGSRFPLVCQEYDFNSKQRLAGTVITLGTDEKMRHYIEIKTTKMENSERFTFHGPINTMTYGSENIAVNEASNIGVKTFIEALRNDCTIAKVMSREKKARQGGGGGSYQRSSGGGSQQQSAPPDNNDDSW